MIGSDFQSGTKELQEAFKDNKDKDKQWANTAGIFIWSEDIFPFCWGRIEVEVSAIKPARDLQVKFF